MKVDAKVPPKAEVSSFYGIVPGSVQLIVPKGSEKAYRKLQDGADSIQHLHMLRK